MKSLFTIVLLISTAQLSWSQVEMKLKPRVTITFNEKDSLLLKQLPYTLNSVRPLGSADSSRFSHTTTTGSVYILPQDNMPWLKPDTMLVHNMPVQKKDGYGNMPNGYRPDNSGLIIRKRKP